MNILNIQEFISTLKLAIPRSKLRGVFKIKHALTFLLLSTGLIIVLVLVRQNQNIRKEASSPLGSATIEFSPPTGVFETASSVAIPLMATTANNAIDGFQVVVSFSGAIPPDLSFSPATPSGIRTITNTITSIPSGKKLSLAFVTIDPASPFRSSGPVSLGMLTFRAQLPGSLLVVYDPVLSKIVQHQTSTDILLPSTSGHYDFAQPHIAITKPNGGENLLVGQPFKISWTSDPSLTKISLQLFSDQNTNTSIVSNITNTGSYNWDVSSSNLITSGVKFKIRTIATSVYNNTVIDDSDDYFFLNHLPSISTSSLPVSQVGQPYSATVIGSDPDSLDKLSVTMDGISNFGLTNACNQTSSQIQCSISGTPNAPTATSASILVTLSDDHGGLVQQTLPLTIKPLPDLTVSSISRVTNGIAISLCNSGGPVNKSFSYSITGTRPSQTQTNSLTLDENSCKKLRIECSQKGDSPCSWPTITALADSTQTISESNENNNSLSSPLCLIKPACKSVRGNICTEPTPPPGGWCPLFTKVGQ